MIKRYRHINLTKISVWNAHVPIIQSAVRGILLVLSIGCWFSNFEPSSNVNGNTIYHQDFSFRLTLCVCCINQQAMLKVLLGGWRGSAAKIFTCAHSLEQFSSSLFKLACSATVVRHKTPPAEGCLWPSSPPETRRVPLKLKLLLAVKSFIFFYAQHNPEWIQPSAINFEGLCTHHLLDTG